MLNVRWILKSTQERYYQNVATERPGRPLEEGGLLWWNHSRINPGNVLEQPRPDGQYSRLGVSSGFIP